MNAFIFYFFTLDHTRLNNTIPDSPRTLQGVTGVATDRHSKHAGFVKTSGYMSTVHKQFQTKAIHQNN